MIHAGKPRFVLDMESVKQNIRSASSVDMYSMELR